MHPNVQEWSWSGDFDLYGGWRSCSTRVATVASTAQRWDWCRAETWPVGPIGVLCERCDWAPEKGQWESERCLARFKEVEETLHGFRVTENSERRFQKVDTMRETF